VSLFWAVLLHVSFIPSRLFNKHQRGFLMGSVVADTLQLFTSGMIESIHHLKECISIFRCREIFQYNFEITATKNRNALLK
jgi:hypothetical protein